MDWLYSAENYQNSLISFQADQLSDPANNTAAWMLVPAEERHYNALPGAEKWWDSSRIDLNPFTPIVKLQP